MKFAISCALLALLAACTSTPYEPEPDPCKAGEATMDCQVKRYHDISVE